MPHILIVCTANICRSPLAEGILRSIFDEEGISREWTVSSAGTWGEAGLPAASNSIAVAKENEIDISNHRSRIVDAEIMKSADLILTMEKGQKEALRIEFPSQKDRILLIAELIGRNHDIEDPINQPLEKFQQTASLLMDIFENGFENLSEREF